jgi:hypothetical protein
MTGAEGFRKTTKQASIAAVFQFAMVRLGLHNALTLFNPAPVT